MIVLVIAIVLNATANILMKVGMLRVGRTDGWVHMLRRAAVQPFIIMGILSFILALGAYGVVLTRLNLSVAYPLMVSLGLVIVVIASYFFLKEAIRPYQVVGFLLIISGVWLVARR